MSSSFYTGVSNFLSAIQGGVDPRTGLFNVNLPLANLRSGDLAGPGLALALHYSLLSDRNDGFGRGFALNLSHYDRQKRKLYLSSGESYSISSSETTVLQQKLKSFIFKKTDDPGATYQIIHKSGLTEILTMLDSGAYTTRIEDALGRWLGLSWEWSGTKHRLSGVYEIKGGKNSPLCSVSYSDNPERAVTFSVLPGDPDAGYDMVFCIRDGELRSVTSHADTPALVWSFTYGDSDPKWPRYLTGMASPTGMKQAVLYAYAGSGSTRFPDGIGLPSLPRVFGHTLSPGGGQPDVLTRWDWTEENYLGRNLPGHHEQWQPDRDLALMLDLQPGYVYGSTENILGADKKVIRTVTRRYNNYHLQVSESTLRDGKIYSVATEYHALPGATPDEQPSQYQLPRRQTETWQTDSGTRMSVTQWQFDASGNLLAEQLPDGAAVKYLYYPAQGESNNCPSDPHGFVRWLKLKEVLPPRIYGDEVRTRTRHYWKKIDRLRGEGYAVLPDQIEATTVLPGREPGEKETKRLRTRLRYTYQSDAQDTLTYGRESRLITTRWPDVSGSPGESYSQTQDFSYASATGRLTRTETLTTHDSVSLTSHTVRHPVLGFLLSEKDAQDVVTKYIRDKLGRILSRTEAPGTTFERTSACEYSIRKAGSMVTATDPRGNQTRIFYDAAGREISQQQMDADGPRDNDGNSIWYGVSSRTFTLQGEVGSTYVTDWQTDSGTEYALLTRFEYDGFGNPCKQITSDGVTVSDTTDPVALTRKVKSSGGSLTSATRTTELDPRLLLPRKGAVAGGEQKCEWTYTWDGHHRLREMTDENGGVTIYTWDDEGRLLTQRLPDGTVVTRTWARHLSGALQTGISVTGKDDSGETKTWDLGTQTFDGAGRLKISQSGGRHFLYSYDNASPLPKSVMTTSGAIIQYTRTVPLYNALATLSASPGTGSQAAAVRQNFTRDPLTGSLLTATEGSTVTENTLFPSGLLKSEKFTSAEAGVREAGYACTLGGAMSGYTDPAGKKMSLMRDAFGRTTRTKDDALTTDVTYDPLGRVKSYTTTEPATGTSLTTALTYDALGRDKTRTSTGSNGKAVKQSLTWFPNGQLRQRVTRADAVLTETFTYDARNRLTDFTATGTVLPADGYGQAIKAQRYVFDALNNLVSVTTTLADGDKDVATYHYASAADPMQLTSVEHTHKAYPGKITLDYDADGRMSRDETGRTRSYDAAGRLVSVSGSPDSVYGYDALNRLLTQTVGGTDSRALYYRGGEQVCEVKTSLNKITRLIKSGHTCLGVSDDDRGVTLTAADRHDSPLLSLDHSEKSGTLHIWSPYGGGKTEGGLPGFNGERTDLLTGDYHLGNGYRAYSPRLMRFTCPDSLSPFGAGGINPYAYCAGDPVNITDPSGHLGRPDYFWGVMGAALGVLGLAVALLSGGLAIAAAGGIMAAVGGASTTGLVAGGLGIASDITGLASLALEESHPAVASALGWTSMAMGLGGALGGGTRSAMKFSAADKMEEISLGSNLGKFSNIKDGVFYFDDTYKNSNRLNIMVHGGLDEAGVGASYIGRGIDIRYHFDTYHGGNVDSYNYIRLLSCYSAEGIYPLGQQVANAFNKETKAFSGRVLSMPPGFIKAKSFNLGGYFFDDINHLLNKTGKSVVTKPSIRRPDVIYRPVKFIPSAYEYLFTEITLGL